MLCIVLSLGWLFRKLLGQQLKFMVFLLCSCCICVSSVLVGIVFCLCQLYVCSLNMVCCSLCCFVCIVFMSWLSQLLGFFVCFMYGIVISVMQLQVVRKLLQFCVNYVFDLGLSIGIVKMLCVVSMLLMFWWVSMICLSCWVMLIRQCVFWCVQCFIRLGFLWILLMLVGSFYCEQVCSVCWFLFLQLLSIVLLLNRMLLNDVCLLRFLQICWIIRCVLGLNGFSWNMCVLFLWVGVLLNVLMVLSEWSLLVGGWNVSIGIYVYICMLVCVLSCYVVCENRLECIGRCWFGKYIVLVMFVFFGFVYVCRYIDFGCIWQMCLISLLRFVFCCVGLGLQIWLRLICMVCLGMLMLLWLDVGLCIECLNLLILMLYIIRICFSWFSGMFGVFGLVLRLNWMFMLSDVEIWCIGWFFVLYGYIIECVMRLVCLWICCMYVCRLLCMWVWNLVLVLQCFWFCRQRCDVVVGNLLFCGFVIVLWWRLWVWQLSLMNFDCLSFFILFYDRKQLCGICILLLMWIGVFVGVLIYVVMRFIMVGYLKCLSSGSIFVQWL